MTTFMILSRLCTTDAPAESLSFYPLAKPSPQFLQAPEHLISNSRPQEQLIIPKQKPYPPILSTSKGQIQIDYTSCTGRNAIEKLTIVVPTSLRLETAIHHKGKLHAPPKK